MPTPTMMATWELDPGTLASVRALLDEAFDGAWTEDDWDHSLGGTHVLLRDGQGLVGHACVVQRRLLHAGRALRTGYVEAVAVRSDARRRSHGTTLMTDVERVVRGGYELGALSATDIALPFYAELGWQRWRGPTSALTPDGVRRTPDDDGSVLVLPVSVDVDVTGSLTCDWRDGDVW